MSHHASRGRLWAAVVGAAVALTVAHADARAGDAPSNLDLMTAATTEVVSDLLTKIQSERVLKSVRLKPFGNTEEYTFIGGVFTSVLAEKGVTTYLRTAAGADTNATTTPLELQFQTLEFGVSYSKVFRSHLIGGKHVRRRADVRISATLVNPRTGAVVGVDEAAREVNDEFPTSDLGRIEEGTFQFLRPAMPSSGWGRVVEPVFVSGIVVGLIYLFFSNQSDN